MRKQKREKSHERHVGRLCIFQEPDNAECGEDDGDDRGFDGRVMSHSVQIHI